ncbi:MAG: hypothetical protein H6818_06870 [Phycisphaerales bacterium]|nr:hypothetical protein [Phycisphaerales bacterium]MCB9864879.1 hypothetical protein [Phycisphaerales bacterium]
MKGIIGLFVVVVIGAGVLVYMQGKMSEDPGPTIYLAFGDPHEGAMEVNICIPLLMQKPEIPPEGGLPKKAPPTDWARRHWELTSTSGDKGTMSTMGSSLLVDDMKVGGSPDFWIKTSAKVGESYTLIYTPDTDEPTRYKFEFEASDSLKRRQRVEFKKMK